MTRAIFSQVPLDHVTKQGQGLWTIWFEPLVNKNQHTHQFQNINKKVSESHPTRKDKNNKEVKTKAAVNNQ